MREIGRALRLLLGVLALAASAAPAGAQRELLNKTIQRRVLPNGLEVIVVENHGVPLATVEIDVKNGAFTQSPEYEGLAHMFEHMFFKGNREYPHPSLFLDRASELGAVFNGTTREEVVNYYLTVPADSVDGAVRFIAAAVKAPIFPEEELAREKEVVLGEYDRQESNPFFGLTTEMGKRLYPGQWSRKNTIGDRQVLRTVTRAKMQEIQKKYYVPNNTALIVAGDVDPARVFAEAERALGDWKRGADPFKADPIPQIPALSKSEAVISESPVGAVTVLIQWQGPSVGRDPGATYAADVFSDALNIPTSAFQQRLVDSGLWQGVGVNYYTLNNVGPITISGQTTPEKLKAALAALYAEIEKLDDPNYFSAEALEQVKAHRTVDSAFGRERTSGFAHTIGFWWSVASLEYYMGYVDNMARQTPRDLQVYAQRYIVGKPHITGVLIHPEARRALRLTEADVLREGVRP